MSVPHIASAAGWPAASAPARVVVSPLLKIALFCAGLLLPLVTLESGAGRGASPFLTDRITMVDVVTLLTVVSLVWTRGIRATATGVVYVYALTVSLGIGIAAAATGDEVTAIITAYVAMLMAFLYWMLGYAVGRSAPLARALMLGIMAGVAWEFAIVFHDYVTGSPWFLDKLSGRVRGTFKKSGQLGAYGFSIAGLLLTMGWAVFEGRRSRRWAVLLGCAGIFMVIAASRRSAMIGLGVWLACFLVVGIRHAGTGSYKVALAGFGAVVSVVVMFAEQLAHSFLGQRITVAFTSVVEGSSFTSMQLTEAMERAPMWFPFGVGLGRWALVTADYELHNGHLALLVEAGVFGLLAFYALVSGPLRRDWRGLGRGRAAAVPTLIATFLLAASVMMLHNRLHRDRGFMLFLGLATSLSTSVLRGGRGTFAEPEPPSSSPHQVRPPPHTARTP